MNEYFLDTRDQPFTLQSLFLRFDVDFYLNERGYMHQKSIELELLNISSSHPLNYSLAFENELMHFAYTIDRRAILQIIIEVRVQPIQSTEIVRRYGFSANQRLENLSFTINHLLELPIRNTTLQQIKERKDAMLDFFRSTLWKVNQQQNDQISIVFIVPDQRDASSFLVGVGSFYREPFKMSRVLARARAKGTDDGWEELDWFKERVQLTAEFWASKSRLVDYGQPEQPELPQTRPVLADYSLIEVNFTLRAIIYTEAEKQAIKMKKILLSRSKAATGLVDSSIVVFAFLNFVIANYFWILIIWASLVFNTCLTIACVYLNNNKM